MKLQHVSYFLAVAQKGSFTLAAQACSVKQPTLSQAIQELERYFGALLFERQQGRGGKAELTEFGRIIRPHFMRIARSAAKAEREAANFRSRPLAKALYRNQSPGGSD